MKDIFCSYYTDSEDITSYMISKLNIENNDIILEVWIERSIEWRDITTFVNSEEGRLLMLVYVFLLLYLYICLYP